MFPLKIANNYQQPSSSIWQPLLETLRERKHVHCFEYMGGMHPENLQVAQDFWEEHYDTDGYNNVKGLISIFKGLFTLDLTLVISGINKFGSGLVFLGGLFGGLCSVTYYVKKNNLSWLKVSDLSLIHI